jgi:hypothetical protein
LPTAEQQTKGIPMNKGLTRLTIAAGMMATLASWGQVPETVPAVGRSAHFEAVASRLQLGGKLFGYVDVDGDLAKIANMIHSQFGDTADQLPPHLNALDVDRVLSDLGLGGIKAMGMSSYEAGEQTHSRAFLYIPEERQGLLKVFGGDAGPFAALSLAPADTDLVVEQTLDLSEAFAVVNKMIAHFGGKEAHAEFASAMGELHPDFGFSMAQIFSKLNTRLIILGRVHPDKPLDIDLGFQCPSFDLLLALDDSAWLYEKIVAGMKAKERPKAFAKMFKRGDGFELLTLPTMEEDDVVIMQPVLYHDLTSSRIYLASTQAFLDLCLGADKARLVDTTDYKAAVAGLPTEGNGLYFGSPKLVQSARSLFEATINASGEGPFAQLEEPDPVGDAVALSMAMMLVPDQAKVIVNQPDGILVSSNSRRRTELAFTPAQIPEKEAAEAVSKEREMAAARALAQRAAEQAAAEEAAAEEAAAEEAAAKEAAAWAAKVAAAPTPDLSIEDAQNLLGTWKLANGWKKANFTYSFHGDGSASWNDGTNARGWKRKRPIKGFWKLTEDHIELHLADNTTALIPRPLTLPKSKFTRGKTKSSMTKLKPPAEKAARTPGLVKAAWGKVRPSVAPLSDAVIPQDQHQAVLSLASKMRDPSLADTKAKLEDLKRAVFSQVDKMILKQDGFDPENELTIVFVPLPCPSLEYYEKSEKTMLATSEAAQATGARVIIVRSLYGLGKHSPTWTNRVTKHLPTRFAEFTESKTVHLAEKFAIGGTNTPWAYVFLDGKLTQTANIPRLSGALTSIAKTYESEKEAAKAKAWHEAATTVATLEGPK